MCECTHTQAVRSQHASCCPAVHLIAVHCTLSLFARCPTAKCPTVSSRTHTSNPKHTPNNELFRGDGQYGPRICCVFKSGCMFPHVCLYACVYVKAEQAALGGVFCCSWGATVLSPNRSLVPAVVPREGFWMRGSNFTHTPPPSPFPVQAGLPHHPLRSLGTGQETKRVGWDVWGGALWPLSY